MVRPPLFAGLALAVFLASPAFADSRQIGLFQSWGAYASRPVKDGSGVPDACYISSRPEAPAEKDSKSHAGVFAEVTHRPPEHHFGVIDILESGSFKPSTPATLTIGKQSFTLFTHGAAAFARDDDDAKIVAAMRGGTGSMVFAGTDKKGKPLKETFSLEGVEAAYQAIGKACKAPAIAAHRTGRK